MTDAAEELAQVRDRQRMAALERSKEVRARNKLIKSLLKSGKLDWSELVAGSLSGDPALAEEVELAVRRWNLETLVRAVPGIGPARAHQVIVLFGGSPRWRVESISFARRAELARIIRAARDAV